MNEAASEKADYGCNEDGNNMSSCVGCEAPKAVAVSEEFGVLA
jgi:hypothetical protein